MNDLKWWENPPSVIGGNFIRTVNFFTVLLIQSTHKQRRVFFNCIRIDISTLFVRKVEIATILLHNLTFSGFLHQIGRYFHLMRRVSGGNNNQIYQKPLLKQDG